MTEDIVIEAARLVTRWQREAVQRLRERMQREQLGELYKEGTWHGSSSN